MKKQPKMRPRPSTAKLPNAVYALDWWLGTIGEQAEVTVNEDELERALIDRARQFPGQEKQVYEFYPQESQRNGRTAWAIFEQKVVNHIAEKAAIGEKSVTRDELVHLLEA